eukprot:CAMPEP_0184483408 /NCGR_PEP_ID=MMETSP0113_2-20130426/5063_1 /TAXON_ID=91329 /ORGANISM="Norrisiella sphaerica, Strain BC52" /LENGTH=150 /DNA_ID=CAMNT_0026863789 /DNA_START=796 /DNA_END=1248 /DNA_ORIENTATION=+
MSALSFCTSSARVTAEEAALAGKVESELRVPSLLESVWMSDGLDNLLGSEIPSDGFDKHFMSEWEIKGLEDLLESAVETDMLEPRCCSVICGGAEEVEERLPEVEHRLLGRKLPMNPYTRAKLSASLNFLNVFLRSEADIFTHFSESVLT